MKKIISVLLVMVMLLSMAPTNLIFASAATSGTTGDCTWTLNGTELTISGNGAMGNYSSTSPWGTNITSVVIENGVTTIGDRAFYDCDSLTSITIPDGVTTIGDRAFYDCGRLTSVTIPDGVTTIGDYVFKGCGSLTSITIPDSVTTIGDSAFCECLSLTSITIPDGVTTIGDYVFKGCVRLTSITIPNSVTTIGEWAFSYCGSLKKVALPTSVTTVEGSTFAYSGVKAVYIPKEITLIKNAAFDETEINYVYYGGSEADEENLTILPNNDSLNSATWVYNATGVPDYILANNPFKDVKKSDFYYMPVLWAVENGITSGTSKTTFSPKDACTRGQIATFLWRAAGQPTPKTSKNPFTDVKKSNYYYKAVLWAVGEGITSGTSKTTFSPNDPCTRGQIAAFLWRANGGKKVNASNPFKDVKKSDYYYNAVLWAVKNGITAGTTKTTFGPNEACTRGQIATFLYRAYN